MINWEIKKMFKTKGLIIGLVLFLILSISMVFIGPQLESRIVIDFKDKPSEEEKFDRILEELEATGQGKNGLGEEVEKMTNEKLNALKFKDYRDVSFWKTFNYRASHPFAIFIMTIIIAILFSNIYTDEITSGVDSLILSSRNKNKVLYSKIALAVGVPIVLYGGYLLLQYIVTYMQYGGPINGDLLSIRILDNSLLLKRPYKICEYISLKIGILSIVFINLSLLASMISFMSKTSSQSISGFLLFIFSGKLLTLVRWLPGRILLLISKANYIDLLTNFNGSVLMYSGRIKILSKNLDLTNLTLAIIILGLFIELFLASISIKRYLRK